MHVTVIPASPRVSQAAIRHLLADPSAPSVRGVYRNLAKVPDEFKSNPRFTAVQGDQEDASSLDFSGSDAVFVVQPPVTDERDSVAYTKTISANVKGAIQKAESVKRVVLLSSMGAQYEGYNGEIATNSTGEKILRDVAPEVVIIRPGYFVENWESVIETINAASFFFTTIVPVDLPFPHVAITDIGEAAAAELVATGKPLESSPFIFELHGPRDVSSNEVHKALEEVTGKKLEMKPVPVEGFAEYFGHVAGPVRAQKYAEMSACFLPGGKAFENPDPTPVVRKGKTEVVEVFKKWFN